MLRTSSIETITPAMAAEWLALNANNRPIKKGLVERFSRDMMEDRWDMNGESIIIGRSGRLLDGQHRLKAIVLSGATIESNVVRGIHDKAFETLGSGVSRTPGDVLSIAGVHNGVAVAAACRWLHRYKTGTMRGTLKITNLDVLQIVASNQDLESGAEVVKGMVHTKMTPLMPRGMAIALYVIFARINGRQAYSFMSQLLKGTDVKEGSPTYLCRQRMMITHGRSSHDKLTTPYKAAYTIVAWNHVRAGRTPSRLWFARKHKFPMAV